LEKLRKDFFLTQRRQGAKKIITNSKCFALLKLGVFAPLREKMRTFKLALPIIGVFKWQN
jgi:hypothetical protein